MSEVKKKENKFSISFDKEARKLVPQWIMIDQLNNQVNARLGGNKWYATHYYSREENDGSLIFIVEVEEIK